MLKKSVKIGDSELSIETGRLAKQADGSVVVRYGDTMLLVTAVSAKEKKDVDFLPLTVEYQEKLYSAGRIPGSYFKREGRLTEKETLASRLVDRSCRPLFPEGYAYETQVIASVISADPENEGDIHGITGASAALWCSDIPFNGPIAGIRVVDALKDTCIMLLPMLGVLALLIFWPDMALLLPRLIEPDFLR